LVKAIAHDHAWTAAVTAFLVAFLLAGGTSAPLPVARFVISLASIALTAVAVWRLRVMPLTAAAEVGLVILAFVIGLFALQLLPLPPVIHTLLPGHESFEQVDALTGNTSRWQALSLSPNATRASLIALLPAFAIFIASLTVPAGQRYRLALGVVGAAVLNVLLALAQKFSGGDAFHIYKAFAASGPTGFFANRNFFAAQLYASLPMLAVLALAGAKTKQVPGWLAAVIALAYFGIVLVGLALSGSRAGIVLCMAAIIGSLFLPWGNLKSSRMGLRAKLLFYVTTLAIFLFGQFGLVGLLRLTQVDPLEDYRVSILGVSLNALTAFFPAGSGFGTFVPIYQMFETPETMLTAYVNHAHNDWLEIVLEGGVPALLLLIAFLLWFGWNAFRIWRRRGDASGDLVMMAASLSAGLLLLHSAVDYPLRTPALMAMFSMCLGLMASPFVLKQVRLRQAPPLVEGQVLRKPLRPFQAPANNAAGGAP
jgi:O-antigen ligase